MTNISNKRKIYITRFGEETEVIDINAQFEISSGHGGGDRGLIEEFIKYIAGEEVSSSITGLDESLESHYISLASEQSRLLNGEVVKIADLRQ